MKTILVATDFSKAAENAVRYAAELRKQAKAKIILFHAFHVPVIASDIPPPIMDLDVIEKDCIKELKKIKSKFELPVNTACVCKFGMAVSEINDYVEEQHIDLVIMGMQGAGFISEKLLGSVSTSLMKQAKVPVLIIDQKVKYKEIKKIVLASDYKDVASNDVFASLKEFAKLYEARVYVLNVEKKSSPTSPATIVSDFMKLEYSLENVDYTFHYVKDDDVVHGINQFVKEKKMHMVAMIPRKRSVFENLFHSSNTKHMAFHTKVPLLILH